MSRAPLLPVLLLALALPGSASIVAGPESQLTSPVVEAAAFKQSRARIATDGDGFLTVWVEGNWSRSAIHGARLLADGTTVGETLQIAAAPSYEPGADVAFGGGRYLVSWSELGEGVFARFVERDGTMTAPFRLSEPSPGTAHRAPRIAFNGRLFLVAWRANAERAGLGAALVSPSAGLVKTIDLGSAEGYVDDFALAAADGSFYLASSRFDVIDRDVTVTKIEEDGSFSARQTVAPGGLQTSSVLGISGDENALLAWTTVAENSVRTIHSFRAGAGGIGPVESFDIGFDQLDALVADHSGHLIIFGSAISRKAQRAGTTETFEISSPPPSSRVDAGATGAAGTVLVSETIAVDHPEEYDLYAHRIGEESFEPLVTAERHQTAPEIAAAGSTRLAVWSEWNATERKRVIAAARIDRNGVVLDPVAIEVAETSGYRLPQPRVASNGSQWLVIWIDKGTLKAARVSRTGRLLDETPATIALFVVYSDDVEVAWDGSSYVIVYIIGTPTRLGAQMNVIAARVSAEGEVLTPYSVLSPNGAYFEPAIAAGPSGSLVVWTATVAGRTEGALLSRTGTVTPIAFPRDGIAVRYAAVAWNGDTFLVAAPFADGAIRWFFVSETGVVTAAPALTSLPWAMPETARMTAVEVQPHGDGFLLTYVNEGTIVAAVINRAGYVEELPVVVARLNPQEKSFGMSGSTIVYARQTDPVHDLLSRIFMRELKIVVDPPRRRTVR